MFLKLDILNSMSIASKFEIFHQEIYFNESNFESRSKASFYSNKIKFNCAIRNSNGVNQSKKLRDLIIKNNTFPFKYLSNICNEGGGRGF